MAQLDKSDVGKRTQKMVNEYNFQVDLVRSKMVGLSEYGKSPAPPGSSPDEQCQHPDRNFRFIPEKPSCPKSPNPITSLYHLSNLSPSSYLHGLAHQDYEHGFIILQM